MKWTGSDGPARGAYAFPTPPLRDGVLWLDAKTGQITDANHSVAEVLGYSRRALRGRALWQVGLFADEGANGAALRVLMEQGYLHYDSRTLQTVHGAFHEVEFIACVYLENDGSTIQCTLRDITSREQVIQNLQVALARELRITEVPQHYRMSELREDAFPGLLVAACYEPALDEEKVGGDFYDAFSVQRREKTGSDTELVSFVVGDVMGKGQRAAALAGRVREVAREFLRLNPDPAWAMTRVNDYLCEAAIRIGNRVGPGAGFGSALTTLALSLAAIDPRTGATTVALAGAEPPVVLRTSGAAERIETHGLLLGVQPGTVYTVCHLDLAPGDTLLMVTDGITEARRDQHPVEKTLSSGPDLLGYEGMLTIAHRNRGVISARAMSHAILKEARAFGNGFRDDVCLLVVRRCPR